MAKTVTIRSKTYKVGDASDYLKCTTHSGAGMCQPVLGKTALTLPEDLTKVGGRRKSRRAKKRGGKSRKNRRRSSRRR